MSQTLSPRLIGQLRLALLGDCACDAIISELDDEARALNLTGAEIDAARGGRSFEAKADAAIALGCAIKSRNQRAIAASKRRAARWGFSDEEIDAVDELTHSILSDLE